MTIFLTGATGFIGGAVAFRLKASGHRIRGLVRSPEKAERLRALGIEPVLGDLSDTALLAREAETADAVVNTADSDDRPAVEAFLDALAGSGKPFLHTSGTSVVADDARGEWASDRVYDEDTPVEPVPGKAARVAIDRMIVDAAGRGVRAIVLCNSLIYGTGPGLHPDSVQIPTLVAEARRTGVVRHIGRGLNIWSNVHVDDMADLYALALDRAPAGAFYYVENGEASFAEAAAAIARRLGLAAPRPWPADEAIAALGFGHAVYALGSNSRVRGKRARAELGWAPKHASLIEWIETEMPVG
ncbi:NAD-dependent epimerase/dehydratase family protein [Inquilinus sp. Marseille-Q2685]|uniref:NAD-dependent epimerase/dehydratase family protein n=1 Tax=Inquilinus sp. Marseille-Q2685 TaxID=2866581 RepID=UPI001CE478C0|nr:NAD-dependent epimerase/dehydratase family protein [Inquilinus sp. Marseille-Q2685]